MQVLKDAGAEGLQIGKIVQELQRRGLRTFEDMTKAKNSIGSSCGHEVAFARVSPGVFALRCLPGVVEVSSCLPPLWGCICCLLWSSACISRGICPALPAGHGGQQLGQHVPRIQLEPPRRLPRMVLEGICCVSAEGPPLQNFVH